jgi:ABC-type sugar transport system permease subunit
MSLLGTAVLFKYFYDPIGGLFNTLLTFVGLPAQTFIRSEGQALLSVAAMDAWRSFGFYTLLLFAGLLDIPDIYYEAARIDGANRFRMFWYITVPLMKRTFLLVLVVAGIDGFQVFAAPYILAGPGRSTLVLSQFIYNEGLRNLNLGSASAAAVVMFVVIMGITLVQLRLISTNWEH